MREPSHIASAAADGDVSPGRLHARPGNDAAINGVSQSHVHERTECAQVPHRREARFQRGARVGDGLEGHACFALLQWLGDIVTFDSGVADQVRVHVNQARQAGERAEVNRCGARRGLDRRRRADSDDTLATDEDCLVRPDLARFHVQQAATAQQGGLRAEDQGER